MENLNWMICWQYESRGGAYFSTYIGPKSPPDFMIDIIEKNKDKVSITYAQQITDEQYNKLKGYKKRERSFCAAVGQ